MPILARNATLFSTVLALGTSLYYLNGCPPIHTIPFNLPEVGVTTMILRTGQVDTVNSCSPATPPAPTPDAPSASHPDEVIAGFDHWRNTLDSCQESEVMVYRGFVKFDMSPLVQQNKQNLINTATLDFDTINTFQVPPVNGVIPNCAAQFQFVQDAWTPGPPSAVRSFPTGGPLGGNYILPGTELPVPALPTGLQMTQQGHFTLNMLTYVQRWLAAGPNNGFMFTSVDESTPLPVPSNTACHTHFANFKLTVNTL